MVLYVFLNSVMHHWLVLDCKDSKYFAQNEEKCEKLWILQK